MSEPRRRRPGFKSSLNKFLRAITRRRGQEEQIEHGPPIPLSARGAGTGLAGRKIASSYNMRREDEPPIPMSARGPKKTGFEELVNSAANMKRRLSIDNLAKKRLSADFRGNSPTEYTPLKTKVSPRMPQDMPDKVKRLSIAVRKIKDEDTMSRTPSPVVTTVEIQEQHFPQKASPVILDPFYTNTTFITHVDSDTTSATTQTESLDESTMVDEDESDFMNSLPPPTFTLDEYNVPSSFDGDVEKIEDRIFELARKGNVEELRTLLETNLELVQCIDKEGSTPIHQAARFNKSDVIEMLIAAPFYADINCKDYNESTPLHWAAVHGAIEAILILCKNGAQINIRDRYGKGPLHLAIVKRCYRGANVMLLYGADINYKRADGSSAFHIACELGDLPTIEWLVTKDKVMVNCRDKQGETPLLRAATQGKLEVVEYIMKTQLMSWNARDDKQQSLLHRAAFYGYYDLISRIAFINPAACKTMLNGMFTECC